MTPVLIAKIALWVLVCASMLPIKIDFAKRVRLTICLLAAFGLFSAATFDWVWAAAALLGIGAFLAMWKLGYGAKYLTDRG